MKSKFPLSRIHPPGSPREFRALGRFRAAFRASEGNENRGSLHLGDCQIPASIPLKVLAQTQALKGGMAIWNGYPRTDKAGNLVSFRILGFFDFEEEVNRFSIRGRLKSWQLESQLIRIEICSNPNASRKIRPFTITVHGILPQPQVGQFWDLEARLELGQLVLAHGQLIEVETESDPDSSPNPPSPVPPPQPSPPSEKNAPPPPQGSPTPSPEKAAASAVESSPPEPPREHLPTMARAEITLKFSQLPTPTPLGGGRVEIALADEATGLVFTASFKNKTWNKNAKKMEEFESWVGAVSGKFGKPTERGFSLEDAGIQVFEKIKKPAAQESSDVEKT